MLGSSKTFARRLLAWYRQAHRKLPWRASPTPASRKPRPEPLGALDAPAVCGPDPYHVLVSEAMLQQTQVATVIPYFNRFIARFPTLADLAAADEQEVLRLWQGLGYYSRARNLQAAARAVLRHHGGRLPREAQDLLKLPGVGRYTAGAVASIAFGRRAPIVDGNVARVLCRVDKIETDPRERATLDLLWRRAEEVLPRSRLGDFNSALMELGATVCTPRSPQCLICPVREHCEAAAAGVQDRIPAPRKAKPTPLERRRTYCIRRRDGGPGGEARWLIEQRPPRGRWAGMWQFVTVVAPEDTKADGPPAALPAPTTPPKRIGLVAHALTHRRYEFDVFACEVIGGATPSADADRPRRWVALSELHQYPLPRPHLKIAEMLAAR